MSTQKIPGSNKQFIQSNDGEYRGNLTSTFCVDLDSEPGVIKPAPRLEPVLDENFTGWDGDIVQALSIHDGYYYSVTDKRAYRCNANNDPTNSTNWSSISAFIGETSVESDSVSFDGKLLVSKGTNIMSYTGSLDNDWWTAVAGGSALIDNYFHGMSVLRSGKDTLFVTDKNQVRYYNSAAGHTTITLETFMIAHSLTPSLDRMWVGTTTEIENNAYIYELRVGDDVAYQAYEIEGRAAFAMFTYKNTPFVITDRGFIQAFNGAGFETVAQFPWANKSKVMDGTQSGSVRTSPSQLAIHPKGARVSGRYAYIFVNTNDQYDSGEMIDPRGYAGVWVLDLQNFSLSHKYALTLASTDNGYSKVGSSGPLLITNTPQTRILVGGSADGLSGVWAEGTGTKNGFFTVSRHESGNVADSFESMAVKNDTLDSSSTITVKSQNKRLSNFPLTVSDMAWLDSSTINTTDDITNVEVGDEMFITNGYGSGKSAHVLEIADSGATKSISLDAAIGLAGETSDVMFENWRKLDPQIDSDSGEYTKIGVGGTSTFNGYKIEMSGDVTVREVMSESNPNVTL